MINSDLDLEALANAYKIDNRLVIKNFLFPDITERMHDACLSSVPFETHYVLDGKYKSQSPADVAALSLAEKQRINNNITAAASQGIGFLYEGYLKSRAKLNQGGVSNKKLAFLHEIFEYMSSDDVLNRIKQITGSQDINGAETQYTRFTPGHFLTRHQDIIPGRERRFVFELGMTKNWHPDWGGLLQFYEKDGTPSNAWMPQFNVLTIFEVSHIHSVTYVNPYASEPRLSLTGWFVQGPGSKA